MSRFDSHRMYKEFFGQDYIIIRWELTEDYQYLAGVELKNKGEVTKTQSDYFSLYENLCEYIETMYNQYRSHIIDTPCHYCEKGMYNPSWQTECKKCYYKLNNLKYRVCQRCDNTIHKPEYTQCFECSVSLL